MSDFESARYTADAYIWAELNRIYPNLACDVRFEHRDASGWWYTFRLKNDARRQTMRVNPGEEVLPL